MGTIIAKQFEVLMNGDPFFYKFDPDLVEKGSKLNGILNLDSLKLADIIKENTIFTNIGSNADVFFA